MRYQRNSPNIENTFAFEQKLYQKLYSWLCRTAGLDRDNVNAPDLLTNFLKYKWKINGAVVKSYMEGGIIGREILYKAIMYGFDISTEMNCYIVLYD